MKALTMAIVRKFDFDTVFDGEGEVLSAPTPRKAFYTVAEIDQARLEGFADGQRAALQQGEIDQAQCLEGIRFAIEKAMSLLAQAAHEHRAGRVFLRHFRCLRCLGLGSGARRAGPRRPARRAGRR